jgi:hypothetical protein
MDKNNIWGYVAAIAVVYFLFFKGATPAPVSGGDTTVLPDGSCNYAPTFMLRVADKWDTSINLANGHLYKVNNGASQTYAGTAVSANKGDKISVLWGYANRSTVFQEIGEYTVDTCGLNQFPKEGNKFLVRNASVTIDCFDEDNNRMASGSSTNYTLGTGSTASVSCRLKLDSNKKGLVHGAVLISEMNATAYKEEKSTIAGAIITGSTPVPAAYSLANAANKAYAYNVAPLMDVDYHPFTVYLEAEASVDPSGSGAAGDTVANVLLSLYTKNCFENSDTAKFECGVETEDSVYAGSEVGTGTVYVD